MEGKFAVQLTNGFENSTSKSKEMDPEERGQMTSYFITLIH